MDAISLAKRGVCHACYGPTPVTVERTNALGQLDQQFVLRAVCTRCGEFYGAPVGGVLLDHPALVEFFWLHGRDPVEEYPGSTAS